MPGFLEKIGLLKKKPAAVPKAGAAPGVKVKKKGFDLNLYMKAVSMFFSDFFGKKLPYFFKNIGPSFKRFPEWWKKTPQDEQLAYGLLVLGDLMLVVGIVLLVLV
jgi:hypothetical protein